jgi:hypothetical protein
VDAGRPPRRVWDDALAWQAAVVHSPRSRVTQVFLWLAVAGVVLVLFQSWAFKAAPAIGFWTMSLLAVPGLVPTTCLSRELQQNTLASLAMLPLSGRDIYEGWLRGSVAWRTQARLCAGVIFLCLLWNAPLATPASALAAVAAGYALPPIVFLETLRGNRSYWRGGLRTLIGMSVYWTANVLGLFGTAVIFTTAALLYRPRVLRQLDERFAEASAS